jgi:hypothetical protein
LDFDGTFLAGFLKECANNQPGTELAQCTAPLICSSSGKIAACAAEPAPPLPAPAQVCAKDADGEVPDQDCSADKSKYVVGIKKNGNFISSMIFFLIFLKKCTAENTPGEDVKTCVAPLKCTIAPGQLPTCSQVCAMGADGKFPTSDCSADKKKIVVSECKISCYLITNLNFNRFFKGMQGGKRSWR